MEVEALEEYAKIIRALEMHRRCDEITFAKVNPHELVVNKDDVLTTRISVHRADTVMQLNFFLNYGANIAFASLHQKELRGSIYFRNILNRKVVEKTLLSMSLIKGNKQVSVGNAFITFTIDERACSAFA